MASLTLLAGEGHAIPLFLRRQPRIGDDNIPIVPVSISLLLSFSLSLSVSISGLHVTVAKTCKAGFLLLIPGYIYALLRISNAMHGYGAPQHGMLPVLAYILEWNTVVFMCQA
ncbi:hypothetical protein H112_03712 [Trichophyton rubrum D6]|uniref:Uncharacterized protein n=3 Tax=Trichophyton TaxID=5550 RepID=A0A080WLX7_TRIRC|nr:uncharacterized protein TERG_12233 [Trichophyton rubrum CBS 118892]EZF23632.1 hypothetical protein H100_03720 [Trichophyton rubrum MR850]EZF42667.1 hypothetical protein H102_03710 [Trichophyton rubrum CBS 100081]EZF53296.1 hypothetical protein H103_03723 [Trichophyton rubrum CBS 288.86]EZF63909.1 hypothetical protein H104_03708 [Trichophyton rubrum CBS 289.86]EZF74536.1 hypothetical protein H105_03737 [Trichophyton soudanense CBS 452.61]EZF85229.1 hypothetical protein H110_03720 [Trichophy